MVAADSQLVWTSLNEKANAKIIRNTSVTDVHWWTNTCEAQDSVTSKKMPNVYKSRPKMISLKKLKILTHLQKIA